MNTPTRRLLPRPRRNRKRVHVHLLPDLPHLVHLLAEVQVRLLAGVQAHLLAGVQVRPLGLLVLRVI
ncbi:MAG: hypothetical protein VYB35_00515 [Verrucomicrobiota bacterium]|nr:hypothetical protein [Verrucomicrobiota bacterium]